jgi:dCMP deaminase
MNEKWLRRFMNIAKEVSTWSKDPSTRIGAVIVNDNRRILATGYNGFPEGVADDERLNSKETKYPLVIHGEANSILNALKNGVSVNGATLVVYGLPICGDCAKMIAQSGIKRVVMNEPDVLSMKKNWMDSWEKISKPLFEEVGIEIVFLKKEINSPFPKGPNGPPPNTGSGVQEKTHRVYHRICQFE